MLNDVSTTAFTTPIMTHISGQFFNFSNGISRTTGTTTLLHDLIIWYVVADKYHFFIGESVFLDKFLIMFNFNATAHVNIFQPKTLIAQTHSWRISACQNGYPQTSFLRKLNGITVFDIDGSQGFSIAIQRDVDFDNTPSTSNIIALILLKS